jgi:hypothetical protein
MSFCLDVLALRSSECGDVDAELLDHVFEVRQPGTCLAKLAFCGPHLHPQVPRAALEGLPVPASTGVSSAHPVVLRKRSAIPPRAAPGIGGRAFIKPSANPQQICGGRCRTA